MATWPDVARALKDLPAIATSPGKHEWRLADKLLAWERPLRKSDLEALGASAPTCPILAVHVPLDVKDMLLGSRPEVYFTTPHFNGYPAILLRLPEISAAELRELLRQAWFERAPRKLAAALRGDEAPAARPAAGPAAKRPAAKRPAAKRPAAKRPAAKRPAASSAHRAKPRG